MEQNTTKSTPGTKRSWDGVPIHSESSKLHPPTSTMAEASESSPNILSMFGTFRDELDQHHDRRERLIKTSRDITALSKKIIFSLQRVRTANTPLPVSIQKETQSRFSQINELFRSTIPDITGLNSRRYLRQLSGGIQEFIEALSFHHYLTHQTLITRDEVAAHLPVEIIVTEEDYAMGLFDLTGELMRFAVTSLSAGAADTQAHEKGSDGGDTEERLNLPRLPPAQAGVVRDLREIRAEFESITVPRRHNNNMFRDYGKKSEVMQNSVEKVERAAYGILVRGSERPAGWKPDLSAGVEMDVY
ncbi:Translin family-domain-containing protein [Aspergillus pseudoustus]|uniref:Translin family-domain-containing protein n=1 Tax=Aspergillus pseudoustus TaxID=1810923 RepID=A0ABR4J6K4_9EURO